MSLRWIFTAPVILNGLRSGRIPGGKMRPGDAAALIDHLGEEKAVVVGSSGGGIVALLTAVLFPEKVLAVIADSTVDHWPDLKSIVARAHA